MKRILFTGLLLAAFATHGAAEANRDPAAAKLVFDDLDRFWVAHDAAADADDSAAVYASQYLEPGTPGLREFDRLRIKGASQLAATIAKHPKYYASLRQRMDAFKAAEPTVRTALEAFAKLYPDAVFPDVYFLIGRMNSGGTISDTGLLIGVEMYGLAAGTPQEELGDWHRAVIKPADALAHIVAHELVHFQQRPKDEAGAATLLGMSLNEGVADFIAELTSGAHINAHVHEWAVPREAELWASFAAAMDGKDAKGWLYDTNPGEGRPADLGYFVGYRIAQCHYARAASKPDALRDLLVVDDYRKLLESSGYAGKPCVS
jgi:hypothetical protein